MGHHLPVEHLARQAMAAVARATTNEAADTATAAVNPHPTSSLQTFGFAIIFFFPALAMVVIGLRMYSRFSTKQFGSDDALILLAMALSWGETGTMYMYMKANFVGIHFVDVPAQYDQKQALIWNFAVQVLYNPILALVKTSFLLFLLKIGGQKPGLRIAIHALNAINLSLMVAIFLVVIFQCKPIAYNWDTSLNGHCIDQGAFYVATAALTIFTDVLNLALPFWVFLGLKVPLRVKIALLLVFLLGGIVTIVGVIRLVFIYRGFFQKPGADPTYNVKFTTSAIETNLAIICASAPSLRGLIRSWFPRFFSSGHSYDYRYPDARGRSGYGRQSSNNPYGLGSVSTNITSRKGDLESSRSHSTAKGDVHLSSRNRGHGHGHGYGRGGGRSRRGDSDVDGGGGGGSSSMGGIQLRDLKSGSGKPSKSHTEVNSHSPSTSEEEIMTYNGIVRTTNVLVQYDNESQRKTSHSRDSRTGSSLGLRTSISGSL